MTLDPIRSRALRVYQEWRRNRDHRYDDDPLILEWFGEDRMPAVEDTGTIVATPEDLAEISPPAPVYISGHGRGRHAKPKRAS